MRRRHWFWMLRSCSHEPCIVNAGTSVGLRGQQKSSEHLKYMEKKKIVTNYAFCCSTTMFTSKIMKQTIEKVFQCSSTTKLLMTLTIWKWHLCPRCPSFVRSGGNATLSGVSAYHYQQSLSWSIACLRTTVTWCGRRKTLKYCNLKRTLEDLLPCGCYTIMTNSKTIRLQVWQHASAGVGFPFGVGTYVEVWGTPSVAVACEEWLSLHAQMLVSANATNEAA